MAASDRDHVLALYDGEIFFTDQYIGYLLERLERQGLAERTLVVVTADHGEEFFEHGGKGHRRTLYEEVLRVPLLARFPGRIPAGLRVEAPAPQVDIVPTILSLLGIELAGSVSGTAVTLSPRGATPTEDRPAMSRLVHTENGNQSIAMTTRGFKYLLHLVDRRPEEVLYDLVRDPGEQAPIVTEDIDSEVAAVLERFRRSLSARGLEESSLRELYGISGSKSVELPEDVREQLRSLGYIP
jgi:arylsulfatase A-like enzyme